MVTHSRSSQAIFSGLLVAPFALFTACSSQHAGLEHARDHLVELRQNPHISANAPVAVREAGQALRRADQVWQQTGDEQEVSHLAYLARQRTEIVARGTNRGRD